MARRIPKSGYRRFTNRKAVNAFRAENEKLYLAVQERTIGMIIYAWVRVAAVW